MKTFVLKGMRKAYRLIVNKKFPRWGWPSDSDWEITNNIIYHLLENDAPCYIGRIGTVEGNIVHNKLTLTPPWSIKRLKGCVDYITGNSRLPWWDTGTPFMELQRNAGFFANGGITYW